MLDFAGKVRSARIDRTHLFFIGQAGVILKSARGQLLAIDPYLSECVERAEGDTGFKRLLPKILDPYELAFDVVICTHHHLDHFDMDSVPEMMGCNTKLFCSVDCMEHVARLQLDYHSDNIFYVKPGDHSTVGDFEITFVGCDHGAAAPGAVGVVVKVDGKTIYEAGDTCLRLDRVDEIPRPLNVLIAPINGAFGNLNEEECAMLAECLQPSVTIPCHYGMFPSHHGDVGIFRDIMAAKKLPFLIMQYGEQYTF